MRISLLCLTLLGAISLPGAALADPIAFYTLSGALQQGTLSGTIRVAYGNLVDANLTLVERGVVYQFGGFRAAEVNPNLTVYLVDTAVNEEPDVLALSFPVPNLTGYPGGSLCSLTFACQLQHPGDYFGPRSAVTIKFGYLDSPTFSSFSDTFTSLSASPFVPTPEPEALGLVGLGLAAVAGAMQRRFRGSKLPRR